MSKSPESHAAAFTAHFGEEHFPAALLDKYIPLELLAENTHSETYLLKDKTDDKIAVARRCISTGPLPEADILPRLSHPGLAAFLSKYEMDGHVFLLREYVAGIPLDEYATRPLPETEALDIVQQLCDVLGYLHSRKPPVIHRDLKPSNIIINTETHRVTLIDFGIAREYEAGAGSDTVYMGTHGFSPPEQYGFSQTDCRADIYALGVVLAWMLTGRSDLSAALHLVRAKALKRIISRCTAFDPQKRYHNAMQLFSPLSDLTDMDSLQIWGNQSSDLSPLSGMTKLHVLMIGGCPVTDISVMSNFKELTILDITTCPVSDISTLAGLPLRQLRLSGCPVTDITPVADIYGQLEDKDFEILSADSVPDEPLEFPDPAFEKALRRAMNNPEGPITQKDAFLVQFLELYNEKTEESIFSDISPLAYFVNLQSLVFNANRISDLTPLSGLDKLNQLWLSDNQITDFSPLSGLAKLTSLQIANNPGADYTPLKNLYQNLTDKDFEM